MKNIQSLIANMTLEEKAALCTGASAWTTTPIERLGVPEMIVSDGPHGVRRVPDVHAMAMESLPATCFPTASCLASTWDVDLIHKMGIALAEECITHNVDVLLGPGANMKRSPLGGRNFEYFSEDPYLAGEMAASFINGVQSMGVGTSLKHYAANNQEFQRFSISAEVDERTLREIYLTAFEKAVKQAQPWTVMCSYNKVNGTFASEHHYLLNEILKDEWGFEGLVVSDWGAVRDRVAALKGGLDWEMPGPQERRVKAVVEAVRSGELDEAILDESVRRILNIVFKAKETPKTGTFDIDAHHELAHHIASEGMVLLKNNGLLPLKGQHHIAVIGRAAENAHFQGGGSSHIHPTKVAVPFKELQTQASNSELTYAEGYPTDRSFRQDMIDQAVSLAKSADVAVLYIALPTFKESEGYDRTDLDLTEQQVALIKAVSKVQPKTVVVLNNGAPVAMNEWIDDVAAVLEGWMMGQAGGIAIADVLSGKVNPSGKLAETFPLKLSDTPSHINWPGGAGAVSYGEGLFIGYRYYDAKEMPVLFPFGHGLSYTTFAYSNAKASAKTFKDTDGLTVTVDVTNTGEFTGKEIVQVYVHDHKSGLVRPQKELKGFAKVELKPGETKSVSVKLDFRAFAYYHPEYKQWITEDGDFDILIAASAADIRQTLTVTLQSTLSLPCILDKESTVREWLADPRGKAVIGALYTEIETQSRKLFGGADERYGNENAMGMDIMDMMNDMPLVSVLMFQQGALPMPAEEMVAGLLMQAHKME
ncbi:glycoside hydrolase family 3 C-terminal domain-containing protein [Candidatus Villigracilis affinis]|uniref:glycoside hydrolase family 3 C-terminal domain-containing protein n=1 Tax=Candidatus Villigracilis affinis TaxID=3140682 RepID=UPI002A207046|nr:glycoside hydrolase family 3 C-terminal domain-containing protein [Anaerolineales bacterium]